MWASNRRVARSHQAVSYINDPTPQRQGKILRFWIVRCRLIIQFGAAELGGARSSVYYGAKRRLELSAAQRSTSWAISRKADGHRRAEHEASETLEVHVGD